MPKKAKTDPKIDYQYRPHGDERLRTVQHVPRARPLHRRRRLHRPPRLVQDLRGEEKAMKLQLVNRCHFANSVIT